MVQLNDDDYTRLKKDADDNRQVLAVVRWCVILIMFFVIFFTWGRRMLDLDISKRQADLNNQILIDRANINTQVKEIESNGMTFDDYIRWLEVRESGDVQHE